MLKKGLMIGVVAIIILVAISVTMGSEDSEADAIVDNNHKNLPIEVETGVYLKFDLGTNTGDYTVPGASHTRIAFLSSNQIYWKNGVDRTFNGEVLTIPETVSYEGEEYIVVGLRHNAFKANESGSSTYRFQNLKTVIFPATLISTGVDLNYDSVETGGYSFSKCLNLETIEFKTKDFNDGYGERSLLKFIAPGTFQDTSLKTLDLTNCSNVTICLRVASDDYQVGIDPSASLETVDIRNATDVKSHAFRDCDKITTIYMPLTGSIALDAFTTSEKDPNDSQKRVPWKFYKTDGSEITDPNELLGSVFKVADDGSGNKVMKSTFKVTYVMNGGDEPAECDFLKGEVLPTPTKTGFTFYKWYNVTDSSFVDDGKMPDHDVRLSAYWVVDVPDTKSFTYDGTSRTPYDDNSLYTVLGDKTEENAGSYTAILTLVNSFNVWDGTYSNKFSRDWSISKADSYIEIVGSQTFTYDGDAPNIATRNKVGDGAVTFEYYTEAVGGSPLASAPINAGTYYVVAIVAETVNYNPYTTPSRVSYTINQLVVDITWTNCSLMYNGKEQKPTATVSNIVSGDECIVMVSGTGTSIGSYQAFAVDLTGSASGNYLLSGTNLQSFTIYAATITVTPESGQSKVYGEIDPVFTYTYSGVADGETPRFTGALGRAIGNSVGDYAINLGGLALSNGTGFSASNYILELDSATVNFTINKKSLEITAGSGSKTYDGTPLENNGYTVTGGSLVSGDSISSVTFIGSQTNAGSSDNIVSDAVIMNGAVDVTANYEIVYINGTLTIDPLTVVLTWANDSLTYNGFEQCPTATVTYLIGSDVCNVIVTGGQTNAGSYTATAVSLDNPNYALSAVASDNEHGFSITPATITVTPDSGLSKVYGSADPVFTYTYTGAVGSEVPGLTGVLVRVSGENVGGYAIEIGSLVLEDNGSFLESNYTLVLNPVTVNFTITPATITVSGITASDKIYDGDVNATLNCAIANLAGKIAGDDLSVTAVGAFDDKNVGNVKTVTISCLALTGNDAFNYVLAGIGQQETATATITPATITVSGITAKNKTYDGTTGAVLNYSGVTLDGVLPGDEVIFISATGAFADKNVGNGKSVTIGNYILGGADTDNYVLTPQSMTVVADITPATITVSGITADNKVYNGNTDATLVLNNANLAGRIAGDDLSVTAVGTFDDKNVGNVRVVTISDHALTGNDAFNYVLAISGQQTYAIANITPATLTAIYAGENIVYGDSPALIIMVTGFVNGEDENTATNYSAPSFASVPTGVGTHTITPSGGSADNYVFDYVEGTLTISKRSLEITAGSGSKTYDGTPLENNGYTVTGGSLVSGDSISSVTVIGSQTNAGSSDNIASDAVIMNGFDDVTANYNITYVNGTLTVNKATITILGITAENKVYNGNTEAVLNYDGVTIAGVITGDVVTITSATGAFADKNVGNGKLVTIGNYILGGADKDNYVLTSQSMTVAADITPATITVSGITASDKVFDGKVSATIDESGMVLGGKIDGDDIVIGALGEFVDWNVGNGKTVNIVMGLEGTDAGNYVLAVYTATSTASITPATITGDIQQDGSLTYDGTMQTADVYITLVSVADEEIVITYSITVDGVYSLVVPPFTDIGDHTVYYRAEAPNHDVKTGSFTVTVSAPHDSDIEGEDHVLFLLIGGIAMIAVAILVAPFIFGRP